MIPGLPKGLDGAAPAPRELLPSDELEELLFCSLESGADEEPPGFPCDESPASISPMESLGPVFDLVRLRQISKPPIRRIKNMVRTPNAITAPREGGGAPTLSPFKCEGSTACTVTVVFRASSGRREV